jgi:hypothetical protein
VIRGNVAVVRHGATALHRVVPFSWELSPSRMRDSGRDQLPPDVRFAGEALQEMRAPPWIAIYLNQPLTEKPSCEAGHMTAPDQCCINVKKISCQSGAVHMTQRTELFMGTSNNAGFERDWLPVRTDSSFRM